MKRIIVVAICLIAGISALAVWQHKHEKLAGEKKNEDNSSNTGAGKNDDPQKQSPSKNLGLNNFDFDLKFEKMKSQDEMGQQEKLIRLRAMFETFCKTCDEPKTAYQFIKDHAGEGDLKSILLNSLFCAKYSDEQLNALLQTMSDPKEQSAAYMGIVYRLSRLDNPALLVNHKFDLPKDKIDTVLKKALILNASYLSQKDNADISHYCNELIRSNIKKELIGDVFVTLSQEKPFDLLGATDNESIALYTSTTQLGIIMQNAAKQNPEKFLNMCAGDSKMDLDVSKGVEAYYSFDKGALDRWIKQNAEKLDAKERDSLYLGYALAVKSDNNFSLAWENVENITDPAIKKQAEGQVWAKELEIVRNSVNKDPQQAITELVSGKSQHDAYWIEEAMDVWMTKDFDKAEQWYQDNWKSLPAEKSQYAAAAFAKQAIKAGDIDAATQWLPFIKDPKTKARIEGELQREQQESNK